MAERSPCGDSQGRIRILIDSAPQTLNPRYASDAYAQRIGALLFKGLTGQNAKLQIEPGFSKRWTWNPKSKTWDFELDQKTSLDSQNRPITPMDLLTCLENYRTLKPSAVNLASFPGWRGTSLERGVIKIQLDAFDPYLPRNVQLLRYFRTDSGVCVDPPKNATHFVTSGSYALESPIDQTQDLLLKSVHEDARSSLRFSVVSDDHTRAMKLIRGEADVVLNVLSVSKQRWLGEHYQKDLTIQLQEGVNVSYLAYNFKHPVLRNEKVRRAIALALPIQEWVDHKYFGIVSPAFSFMLPKLEEAWTPENSSSLLYNPSLAEQLLDEAGFKRDKKNIRFHLELKTTATREGYETSLLLQDALKKIGIEIKLIKLEPAAHLAALKRKDFDIYISRWIGVADASILYRTLHSKQPNNRASYVDQDTDELLEKMIQEGNFTKRRALAIQIQKMMSETVPYLPLWFWKNTLLHRKELSGITLDDISLSGAFLTFKGAFCEKR